MINETLRKHILTYAKSQEPHECCGFVVLKAGENLPHFLPCENAAEDKENHFEISPEDYLNAEQQGEIVALVHSHPNGEPVLSVADLQTQLYIRLRFQENTVPNISNNTRLAVCRLCLFLSA